jgi:hypothetical protein
MLHDFRRPSFIFGQFSPVVVILQAAAHVHHVVDAARPAEQLSARDVVDFSIVPFLLTLV